ncbi:MAG: SDR family NAD(P)-dependent oxidoreductase, partial [Bacilli bacterium]
MKLFLTGATGFLGGQLVKHFVKQQHEVILLARNIEKAEKMVRTFTAEEQQYIEVVQGDIIEHNMGLSDE